MLVSSDSSSLYFNELVNLDSRLCSIKMTTNGLIQLKNKNKRGKKLLKCSYVNENKENKCKINLALYTGKIQKIEQFEQFENLKNYNKITNASTSTRDTMSIKSQNLELNFNLNTPTNIKYQQVDRYFMCLTPVKKINSIEFNRSLKNICTAFFTSLPSLFSKIVIINPNLMNDIYSNIIEEEKCDSQHLSHLRNSYNEIYSNIQTEVNEKMRAVLIDWLIEVHHKFKLLPETLFLTIRLIDTYLSYKFITQNNLQLLGVTSLWLACKYEEISSPFLKDCEYITANAYTQDEIKKMELDILCTLNYNLTFPSILTCFDLLAVNFGFAEVHYYLGKYLLELFLLDQRVNKYSPSLISASTAYLVMKFCKDKFPYYSMINYYTLEDERLMKECASEICFLLENIGSTNFQAVKVKYSMEENLEVSKLELLQQIKKS